MNSKLQILIATFLLAVFHSLGSMAQRSATLYVVEHDVIEKREHPCVVPGRVTQEFVDRIERITYLDSTMTIIYRDGTVNQYLLADIARVATSSGGFYATTSFLPDRYKALLDFDSHYEYPGAEDSTAYASDTAFVATSIVNITLGDDTILVGGDTALVNVTCKDGAFCIASVAAGIEYRICGQCDDRILVFEGDKSVRIVLDNVHLQCADSAAIISRINAPIYITTAPGSYNDLTAIWATEVINLSGEGVLRLVSDADEIALLRSASDINICGGVYDLFASGTDSKGIHACRNLTITAGNYHIITTGASFDHTEESLGESCSYAILANELVTLHGGKYFIKTFGTKVAQEPEASGAVGIASLGNIVVNGGEYYIAAFDDPVNTPKTVIVNGGRFVTTSLTDDGFNANTLKVTGGEIYAYGPDGGFDTKSSNAFTVSNGTLIGIGPKSSKSKTGESYQPSLYFKDIMGLQKYVRIVAESGEPFAAPSGDVLVIETPAEAKMCMFFTSQELERDHTYHLETATDQEQWHSVDGSATLCK